MIARRAISAAVAALALAGCRGESAEVQAPLRPLLYTEAPAGTGPTIPGFEEWVDPNHDPTAWPTEHTTTFARRAATPPGPAATPEALVLDVFEALASGDVERLRVHAFDGQALATASRMSPESGSRTADEIWDETLATLRMMAPRPGARAIVLQPGQVTIGRPRAVDGSVAEEDEAAVMHWGNELTFTIRGTDLEFTLRFPNLLVDERGLWKLRAAPTVEAGFEAYRDMGLDLMPELMDTEHAPIPLSVGNYWHYQTRRPGTGEGETAYGTLTRDGHRDSVVEVSEHQGYRVARFRRVYDDPNRSSSRFAWLVTPTRLFECGRECVRRADDPAWVLAYGRRTTPLCVFPVERGTGWGAGGHDTRNNAWRVAPEPAEVSVPAGTFPDAFELVRSTAAGRESTYFVPGIGMVMLRTQSAVETLVEELVDYRILP